MAQRIVITVARIAWCALPITVGQVVGSASDSWPNRVRMMVIVVGWAVWGTGLIALLVPSTVALTLARTLAGVPIIGLVIAVFRGRAEVANVEFILGFAVALILAVAVASADFGRMNVQRSAYGDETRLPLKPPLPVAAAVAALWLVASAIIVVGLVCLIDRRFGFGLPVVVIGVVLIAVLGWRGHRLARRWLVFVPAGVVVHDAVVFGDTPMFRSAAVRSIGLTAAGSDAADATGGTTGYRVTIALADHAQVVFAPDRANPKGRAIHALSVQVAPSRPGQAIAEARRRGIA